MHHKCLIVCMILHYISATTAQSDTSDPFNGIFRREPKAQWSSNQGNDFDNSNTNNQFPQGGFEDTGAFVNTGFDNTNANKRNPQNNFGGFNNQQGQAGTLPTSTTPVPDPRFQGCLERCRAQTIVSHNPVCGTNGQIYRNMPGLKCAKRCGVDVEVSYHGFCGRNPGGK